MIKAYHIVPEASIVDQMVQEGFIYPAVYIMNPSSVRERCAVEADDLYKRGGGFGRKTPEGIGLEIMRSEFKEAAERFISEQRRLGVEGDADIQMGCSDIWMGDYNRVFLSALDWYWRYEQQVEESGASGFVFDALYLVKQGARVREYDLMLTWDQMISSFVKQPWTSKEEAMSKLERAIKSIFGKLEHKGREAEAFLEKAEKDEPERKRKLKKEEEELRAELEREGTPREMQPRYLAYAEGGRLEMVFDGPLPIEWAREVWKGGRRVH